MIYVGLAMMYFGAVFYILAVLDEWAGTNLRIFRYLDRYDGT